MITLAVIIVIAVLIAYLVVRRGNVLNHAIDTISMLPYIMPGAVIGISLILAFSRKPAVLSFVSIITEMSSGVILYNNRTITLTLSTYAAIVNGTYGVAAVFATITMALTVLCLVVYLHFTDLDHVQM